ncbi:MAG: hypothetical protein WDN50_08125 [Bradyrhizobium sp.]
MNLKISTGAASASVALLLVFTSQLRATESAHQAMTPDAEIRALYKQLIDAENAHDLATVRRMVWKSPSALFVAKTKTPAEGNWAGFWGAETVVDHIGELFQGTFLMTPDL